MMGSVVALDTLFHRRQVWKGQPQGLPPSQQPTGHAALDQALPTGGWPEAALSEILLAAEGVGELQLIWPTLARLSAAGERIVLVAPPHIPYPAAWQAAGVELDQMSIVRAAGRLLNGYDLIINNQTPYCSNHNNWKCNNRNECNCDSPTQFHLVTLFIILK